MTEPAGDRLLRRRRTELVANERDRDHCHPQTENTHEDAHWFERSQRLLARHLQLAVVQRPVPPEVDRREQQQRAEPCRWLTEGNVRVLEPVPAERPGHRGVQAESEQQDPRHTKESGPALALDPPLPQDVGEELGKPQQPRPRRDGDELVVHDHDYRSLLITATN